VKRDIDLEIYFLNSFRFKLLVVNAKYLNVHNIEASYIKLYKLLVSHTL
jgi:hypothetical protein